MLPQLQPCAVAPGWGIDADEHCAPDGEGEDGLYALPRQP